MVSAAVSVWILSIVISVPPLFYFGNETSNHTCSISKHPVYQFYATITAFYAPVILMCIAYGKIYQAAARINKEEQNYVVFHRVQEKSRAQKKLVSGRIMRTLLPTTLTSPLVSHGNLNRTTSSFHSRELKAFRTLTAIVFAFLISWMPFFILALIRPFCDNIPKWSSSLTLWLGYCNSTINPILYSIFNKDFRRPFAELLRCRCRSLRKIMRTESYEAQFGLVVTQPRTPPTSSPEPNQKTRARFYVTDSEHMAADL